MVAVLLIPVAVLVLPCLLALLERRLVAPSPVRAPAPAPAGTPVARAPVAHREPADDTDADDVDATDRDEPVAPVVPLHAGPSVDGDTIPLRRAS